MAKSKTTAFFCKECGNEFSKWMGQCPSCHAWNSIDEASVIKAPKGVSSPISGGSIPIKLSEVDINKEDRYSSGFNELDRVLGGGIVAGSMVLVGGDPGIGKSTILLQVCANIAKDKKILYISGEESPKQIKLRADRIGNIPDNFMLLCETNLGIIDNAIRTAAPDLVAF